MKPDLRQAMREQLLIGDGAIGTYLYQLGFPIGISYEELNLTKPDIIADIHRQYYEAGARVIETNTFTANHDNLSKYGLENSVDAINRAGVAIARSSVGEDAYVVGAVGSIRAGRRKNLRTVDLKRYYSEQIHALLDEGVDGILLETFFDLEEMLLAIDHVRQASDVPIIAQFAVESDRTTDGVPLQEAFARTTAAGADMVGLNCRSGPNHMLRLLSRIQADGAVYSAYPNAGLPDYEDGEISFAATPEYMAESAMKFADLGVRLIGGCCGTTPQHIRQIQQALARYNPSASGKAGDLKEVAEQTAPIKVRERATEGEASVPKEPTILELVKQRHTVIVELDPPKDLSIKKFIKGAEALKAAGADALTMADNSLAVTRMSNMALGAIVREQVGIRPLIHIACRDRNLIGSQSHMMGLNALGIDHVLAVTGDPARFGDLPGASSVYDTTSFEMIRMIKQLNDGTAFSGKPLKQKAEFVVGAAFNPNVKYLDKAVQRLERKVEAGADYIMTQPVFSAQLIEDVYEATKHLQVPIFIGIWPLASEGNAEYLHNEVPGIKLSDDIRQRMSGLSGDAGKAMGIEIAKELLDTAMTRFNGIYLMTPFLVYEMTAALTRYVWEKSSVIKNG